MKILIIGSNGMLGHSLYRYFSRKYDVIATARSKAWDKDILEGYDISDIKKFENLIHAEKPNLVFNCVGIIKQLNESKDNEICIHANALWPHQLASICKKNNSKLIHFSTDCVFSGENGMYTEASVADSRDLYGLSKYLGEVHYDHTLTLRTSIIGHELNSNVSLVDWFLSQVENCKGFRKAIYSGFPTNSLARVIDKYVLERFLSGQVHGLYHISTDPINKYDLLKLVASKYNKNIEIEPYDDFAIDRSLNSTRFQKKFGYKPDSWEDLVNEMHELYLEVKGIE